MTQGDQLGYLTGQRINPFGDKFRDNWNRAAEAAEAAMNPQVDGQGIFEMVPGESMNMEIHPDDAPDSTGAIHQGPRILAWITGPSTAENAGGYTAAQVVYDDSEGEYTELSGGFIWDDDGDDLPDLYCRQGMGGVPVDTPVEVWAEIGDDGEIRWVFDMPGNPMFRARITASSDLTSSHGIAEIDGNGDDLVGGRTATDARCMNDRIGILVNTQVFVLDIGPAAADGDPRYWFTVGEGLTSSPFDLTSDSSDISSGEDETRDETWDVEQQESGRNGVLFQPARVYVANNDFSVFTTEVRHDSSGDLLYVDGEVQGQLIGDEVLQTLEGHIQIGGYDGATDNSKKILLGPSLDADSNLTIAINAASPLTVNGSAGDSETWQYDNSGRYTNGGGTSPGDRTMTFNLGIDLPSDGSTGSGLPAGAAGQVLVHDGANWVAQNTVTEDVFTAATIDGSDDLVFTRKTVTIIASAAAANATVLGEECP